MTIDFKDILTRSHKKRVRKKVDALITDTNKFVNLFAGFERRHPGTEFEFYPYGYCGDGRVIFWCNGKQKSFSYPDTLFQARLLIIKAEFFMWRCEDGKLH